MNPDDTDSGCKLQIVSYRDPLSVSLVSRVVKPQSHLDADSRISRKSEFVVKSKRNRQHHDSNFSLSRQPETTRRGRQLSNRDHKKAVGTKEDKTRRVFRSALPFHRNGITTTMDLSSFTDDTYARQWLIRCSCGSCTCRACVYSHGRVGPLPRFSNKTGTLLPSLCEIPDRDNLANDKHKRE